MSRGVEESSRRVSMSSLAAPPIDPGGIGAWGGELPALARAKSSEAKI